MTGQIFISHSSGDNAEAEAMRDWLATEGWDDVFLDLNPAAGLAPGQRWRDELRKAGERCSAIVVLVSPQWAASKWCLAEFLFAAQLGKEIFPVLITPCPLEDLPIELTATYQFADVSTPEKWTEGHERLRIGLQRAGLHPGAFPWPPEGEPNRPIFRGLRVLEEPDAAIFFGRDAQITKALDAIRRLRDGAPERMLVILGASGAGKSSFLRAGLLARLKRDTERFLVLPTLRPGRAALTGPTGLQHAVGLDGPLTGAKIGDHLANLRAQVVAHMRRLGMPHAEGVAAKPPTVILPIDQAEELFVAGDAEAAAVVSLIVDVLEADSNLLMLLTIRSDSFALLQGHPRLSAIPRLPFDLPRLPPAALKDVIEGPTRLPRVDLAIDADLTEQLIEDFEGADALSLLAFTLERLVIDYGSDGRLEKNTYLEEMKGVGGAIRKAVEIAFAKAAETPGLPRTRAELDRLAKRSFVPGLVRIDDIGAAPKRRVALRSQLPAEALPLIDCLVDQRLLVADATGAEATVEVSHEAVLRHWHELAAWIAERREDLALYESVTVAANAWQAAEGPAKAELLVHRGERLRAAEKLLQWEDLSWKPGDYRIAYLMACRKAETAAQAAKAADEWRKKRLRQWVGGLVAVAAIVTVLGALLVVTGQRTLGNAQSLMLARTAERFAAEGDHVRALRLAILASHDNGLIPASPEARAALSFSAQTLNLLMELRGHEDAVLGAVYSADGRHILTWSLDGTARLWDAASGKPAGPPLRHDVEVRDAVFAADGRRILTWSADGTARLWETASGKPAGVLRHDAVISGAVFAADGGRILTWSEDDTARLWDAASGEPAGPPLQHDKAVLGAVFAADGGRILTWSWDGTARLWETTTGKPVGVLRHDAAVSDAIFATDGGRILTWSADGTARLWDAASGKPVGVLRHDDAVSGAVFATDGGRILTWSQDGTARLWDAASGEPAGVLRHDAAVWGAVFAADGRRILTWSADGTARLWETASGEPAGVLRHDAAVWGAVFAAGGRHILTRSRDGTARLWDAASGKPAGPPLRHDKEVRNAVFAADGRHILTWSKDGTARLWETASGEPVGVLRHDKEVWGAVFAADGRRILTWSRDGTARLWDAASGEPVGVLRHDAAVLGAVFAADGRRILTWSEDGTARLWDAASGEPVGPALRHDAAVWGAVFAADGGRILTWSVDGTARLWDAASGGPVGVLRHDAAVLGAVFAADGRRILTWSADGTARLWDAASGEPAGVLRHDDEVLGAIFAADGRRILTFSKDGTAWLWDAATVRLVGALRHDDEVLGAVFAADGGRILTWSEDGTARLWETASGEPAGPLRHDDKVQDAVFAADGGRILTWSADGTARLWDAASGEPVGVLRHDKEVWGAVFAADGGRILTWSKDGTARLWDAASGEPAGPPLRHDGAVEGAVLTADGRRILTWSRDKTARLWDAASGEPVGVLRHDDEVWGAVYSADGRRILTWSQDGPARLWDVHWAMRDPSAADFVRDLCRQKLVGVFIPSRTNPSAPEVRVGVRHIDARETEAAPILRGREGEDVCASSPTTWETLLSLLRLPTR